MVSAGRELDAASAIFIADDRPKNIIFRCIGLPFASTDRLTHYLRALRTCLCKIWSSFDRETRCYIPLLLVILVGGDKWAQASQVRFCLVFQLDHVPTII